jgi:pyruvate dehydrogenase E2 component (dihydrolipoamide acetyltransferase)
LWQQSRRCCPTKVLNKENEMATIIRMPEVAANATHATLVSWSKKEGDTISSGQSIADVETEKAVIELNVDSDGTIARLLVSNGSEVPVGAPIAVLIAAGESVADADRLLGAEAGSPHGSVAQASHASTSPESASSQPQEPAVASPALSLRELGGQRIFSSPVARLLAKQHGLDIASIAGSGPNGRIVKHDVLKAVKADQPVSSQVVSRPSNIPLAPSAVVGYTDIPHSNMRRTIARRLLESKSTVPHFYLTVHCRVDKLMAMRADINAQSKSKISVNDFVVLAAARALREVPGVNVSWTDAAIRQFHQVDISIAVSTDAGLITPILKNVNGLSLSEISQAARGLAERARQGQLRPEEFQGGSFSISNLGMHGVDEFAAIINPPQAAILAVGAVKAQPVVGDDGSIVAGQVMTCTLSVDHRAVDGALAATWLAAFRQYIESPYLMLV